MCNRQYVSSLALTGLTVALAITGLFASLVIVGWWVAVGLLGVVAGLLGWFYCGPRRDLMARVSADKSATAEMDHD